MALDMREQALHATFLAELVAHHVSKVLRPRALEVARLLNAAAMGRAELPEVAGKVSVLMMDASTMKKPGTHEGARFLGEVFGVVEAHVTGRQHSDDQWFLFDMYATSLFEPRALARQIAMAGLALRGLANSSLPEPQLLHVVEDVLAASAGSKPPRFHPADFDTVEASFRSLQDAYAVVDDPPRAVE